MNEQRRQILEMLAQGRINAEEAERLLAALEKNMAAAVGDGLNHRRSSPKYLRVLVESDDDEHGGPTKVNVRVPIQLLRAGVKLASVVPAQAKNHINTALKKNGIEVDIGQITPQNLEELISSLEEFTVDVDERNNKVRVFCE